MVILRIIVVQHHKSIGDHFGYFKLSRDLYECYVDDLLRTITNNFTTHIKHVFRLTNMLESKNLWRQKV